MLLFWKNRTVDINNKMQDLEFKTYQGKDISPFIDEIGQIRLDLFKEFPYLYKGDLDYERAYLSEYSKDDQSLLILVYSGNKIVAFITGTAISSQHSITEDAFELFQSKGLKPSDYYYIGEIIVLKDYRSFNLSSRLLKEVENFALENGYSSSCFLTVVRDNDHPLRPEDYKDSSKLWKFHNYKQMNLYTKYKWNTIINDSEAIYQENTLEYWSKSLKTQC